MVNIFFSLHEPDRSTIGRHIFDSCENLGNPHPIFVLWHAVVMFAVISALIERRIKEAHVCCSVGLSHPFQAICCYYFHFFEYACRLKKVLIVQKFGFPAIRHSRESQVKACLNRPSEIGRYLQGMSAICLQGYRFFAVFVFSFQMSLPVTIIAQSPLNGRRRSESCSLIINRTLSKFEITSLQKNTSFMNSYF